MSYLYIDKIIDGYPHTSTQPLNCVLNNNEHVIFKCYDNQEGVLSLINEWVSYKLACHLRLPIPNAGLARLDLNTAVGTPPYEISSGLGFYSTRLNNILNMRSELGLLLKQHCINLSDFPRILLFDHLIFNTDRNPGNLLYSIAENKIYIIDHTHVFPNRVIWDKYKLKQCMEEKDIGDTSVMEWNEFLYNMFFGIMSVKNMNLIDVAHDFQTLLNKDLIKDIVYSIPEEWKIDCDSLDMLIEYISYRLVHLEDICNTIFKYKEV
ncbi:HipA family kinase [Niameybacter massiliensis]|uniref:HipA family kinase n=1 Tax=Niameybacter massiliensis TaxID=1658108 RepID=UPI0006B49DD3|nr:HipA family kinase [Niameybacter massiliensis]